MNTSKGNYYRKEGGEQRVNGQIEERKVERVESYCCRAECPCCAEFLCNADRRWMETDWQGWRHDCSHSSFLCLYSLVPSLLFGPSPEKHADVSIGELRDIVSWALLLLANRKQRLQTYRQRWWSQFTLTIMFGYIRSARQLSPSHDRTDVQEVSRVLTLLFLLILLRR